MNIQTSKRNPIKCSVTFDSDNIAWTDFETCDITTHNYTVSHEYIFEPFFTLVFMWLKMKY